MGLAIGWGIAAGGACEINQQLCGQGGISVDIWSEDGEDCLHPFSVGER